MNSTLCVQERPEDEPLDTRTHQNLPRRVDEYYILFIFRQYTTDVWAICTEASNRNNEKIFGRVSKKV
jgi:hypothetical protein